MTLSIQKLSSFMAVAVFSATASPLLAQVSDVHMLDFHVLDVEYSDSLESLVFVSTTPTSQVHIFDPILATDVAINLPTPPTCVGLNPAGTMAAVGHDGFVSLVDLQAQVVVQTFGVSTDCIDVVLADNGWVYCFPRQNQWEQIRSIEIATGNETTGGGIIRAGTLVRPHPNGLWIYGADNGLSPSDIEKYNISNGAAQVMYDSPYHGDFSMCGNLWITEDGLRIITRCRNTFLSSAVQSEDMTYQGALSGTGSIIHATHSTELGRIAIFDNGNDGVMHTFEDNFLVPQESYPMPQAKLPSGVFNVSGKFVYFNQAGTRAFAVVEADGSSGTLYDFGLVTVSFDVGCTGTSTRYCTSVSNSTGNAASIQVTGSLSVSANDTWVQASNLPPSNFGMVIYGSAPGAVSVGNGTLCIDIFQTTIHRYGEPILSDATGNAAVQIDFPNIPGNASLNGGSTHYFQYWYRDNVGARSNLTDAMEITFCD